jgi:SAM-dependent methyltransferase
MRFDLLNKLLPEWYQEHRQLQQWREALQLDKHEIVYHDLFSSVNGFSLSRQSRIEHDALDYTYGEIRFTAFIALLFLANPDENTVFYDLGSGIGTAVIACAMVFPVKKSVGVEYLDALHQAAVEQKKRLDAYSHYQALSPIIDFMHADFLEASMDDATFIFINSTAYFGDKWLRICQKIDSLPLLHTVITFSKTLRSSRFVLIQETQIEASWGYVHAYIHQRA